MPDGEIIGETDLRRYCRSGSLADWPDRARALLNHQRRNWPRAREAFAGLAQVRMQSFRVGHSTIRMQYNPGRFANAIANLDPDYVRRRKCLLCRENRASEQLGLAYEDYLLVVNPAPIFSEHFTFIHNEHRPQGLRGAVPVMLRLARDLTARYTVLYNAPGVGASWPEHLHLQVCRKGVLPVEHGDVYHWLKTPLIDQPSLKIHRAADAYRTMLRVCCGDADRLTDVLHTFFDILAAGGEPALNVVCRFDASPDRAGGIWTFIVVARSRFRPSCYSAEAGARMLVSPGVIDMAGVVITPRRQDFDRMDADLLETILGEVSLDADAFEGVCARLAHALQA